MKIYHNPRCRKSRETLSLILEKRKESDIEIIEYLNTPPTEAELANLIKMLGISAEALLRKGEDIYKTEFKGKNQNDAEWIKIMIAHPKLIERPIVVSGSKAIIGRPPLNVLVLFE